MQRPSDLSLVWGCQTDTILGEDCAACMDRSVHRWEGGLSAASLPSFYQEGGAGKSQKMESASLTHHA